MEEEVEDEINEELEGKFRYDITSLGRMSGFKICSSEKFFK